MNNKLKSFILQIVSILLVLGAVASILPYSGASQPNGLGYRSFCSFTPASFIIMCFGAYILMGIRKKMKDTPDDDTKD